MAAEPAPLADDADVRAPLARFGGVRPPAPAWFDPAIAWAPERRFIEADGAAIELLTWGERGRPGLLLLHGGRAHAGWWRFIAPFFAREFRVAAISWSGMGGSAWREAYSLDLFASEALAGAEAAGLYEAPSPPVVVAHSLGGWVAIQAAATYGERLKAAVILDSGPRPPGEALRDPPRPARPNRVYPTLDAALAHFRLLPAQTCDNAFLLDLIAREALTPTDGGWTWRFDPFLTAKVAPGLHEAVNTALPAAKCPVALMWGERSALMTGAMLDHALALAPPGSPRIEIPGAAHHLFLDQPLAVVTALRGLLAGWPGAAARTSPAASASPARPRAQAVRITPPGRPLGGEVVLPGSKSITNRALLLAGLAKGRSRLTGALKSDDTRYMAKALQAMGVAVHEPDATTFEVVGPGRLSAPAEPLFLGNAGTATRFLAAAAALADGPVTIDGDAHMRTRPIAPLAAALAQLGVEVHAPSGCPPLTVVGRGRLAGGRVEIDAGLSSQYVSALLMAAACAEGEVEVALKGPDIGARGYVDLTLAAMRAFGASVEPLGNAPAWRVRPTGYRAADVHVEPDASAATYLWAAEALTGGRIDLGLAPDRFSQPDAKAHALIAAFPHMPAVIDGAQMQDAVPTLAVLAAFNATPVRFTGIANLRVKECDRVAALTRELSRVRPGLAREEGDDLVIAADPALPSPAGPVRLETYDDHRMAMSLALLGLRLDHIVVLDPGCVAKTYPGYWRALEALGVALTFED